MSTDRLDDELARREAYLKRKRERMPVYTEHTEALREGHDAWADVRESRHLRGDPVEHPGFRVLVSTDEIPIIVVDMNGEAIRDIDDSIEPIVVECRMCGEKWSSRSAEQRVAFFEMHQHGVEPMSDGTGLS